MYLGLFYGVDVLFELIIRKIEEGERKGFILFDNKNKQ